jgi:hypothetical protein
MQFSYQFAILKSVCNSHISLQFSPFEVWFLRGRLQFSYQFAIFISVCNFHFSLQFSCHGSITSLCGFAWFHVTMTPHNQSAMHVPLKQIISPCSTVELKTPEDRLLLTKGHATRDTPSPQSPQMPPPPCWSPPQPPLPFPFPAPLPLCCRCHGKIFPFIPCLATHAERSFGSCL